LADANLYRVSSKELHPASGLVYYLYRFYDANLQRWLNRDPLEEENGVNLYQFNFNAPVVRLDTDGLSSLSTPVGWIGLVEALGEEEAAGIIGPAAARAVAAALAAGAVLSGDRSESRQHGKGERGWQRTPPNKYKGWRIDPEDPSKILGKDQNGKDISKPRPADFPCPPPEGGG
jgi:RHS repeat-associated protein